MAVFFHYQPDWKLAFASIYREGNGLYLFVLWRSDMMAAGRMCYGEF